MKKKILLIRSVNLQQLDKNLPEIYKRFPDSDFYLLTHSHNIQNCKKYKGINRIIDYKKKGSFTPFFPDKELRAEKFDTVVYFVSNIKGYGFLNVLLLAQRLSEKSVFRCNLNSKIEKISRFKTMLNVVKAKLIFLVSTVLIIPLIPIALIYILIFNIISKQHQ